MNINRDGVLIISCCVLPAEDIVLQIIGAKSLPESSISYGKTKGYLWSFENKYYSAEVNLFSLEKKDELDSNLLSTIRAIVFCYDPQKKSSFEDVLSWMPLLKEVSADVQVLISNSCSEESNVPDLDKKNVLDWCLDNQFELIEPNISSESDDEDAESFKDVTGYQRVIQALQSHTWANMIMKPENDRLTQKSAEKGSSSETKSNKNCSAIPGESDKDSCNNQSSSSTKNNQNGAKTKSVEDQELLLEEKWLDGVLNGEDPGGESFEALFARFASVKEKAAGLSGDERKKYAEKTAIAFWRAMGGDEDEIEGLDEDD